MKPLAVGESCDRLRRRATRAPTPSTAPDQAERQRLAQDQRQDPLPPPAQGAEHADLAGPLEDGHHHRVQHADRAQDQRDRRGGPGHRLDQADLDVALDVVARGDGRDARDRRLDPLAERLDRRAIAASSATTTKPVTLTPRRPIIR